MAELIEIEKIKKELSKKDVPVGTEVLERAILLNNERDELDGRDIGKRGLGLDSKEIKYPNLGEFLLKNPFKKEKEGKKKKKHKH